MNLSLSNGEVFRTGNRGTMAVGVSGGFEYELEAVLVCKSLVKKLLYSLLNYMFVRYMKFFGNGIFGISFLDGLSLVRLFLISGKFEASKVNVGMG